LKIILKCQDNIDRTLEIIDGNSNDTVRFIITEDVKELASVEVSITVLSQLAKYFTKNEE
jgi:hypothetical protein